MNINISFFYHVKTFEKYLQTAAAEKKQTYYILKQLLSMNSCYFHTILSIVWSM